MAGGSLLPQYWCTADDRSGSRHGGIFREGHELSWKAPARGEIAAWVRAHYSTIRARRDGSGGIEHPVVRLPSVAARVYQRGRRGPPDAPRNERSPPDMSAGPPPDAPRNGMPPEHMHAAHMLSMLAIGPVRPSLDEGE
jgi:hypothetical protein